MIPTASLEYSKLRDCFIIFNLWFWGVWGPKFSKFFPKNINHEKWPRGSLKEKFDENSSTSLDLKPV